MVGLSYITYKGLPWIENRMVYRPRYPVKIPYKNRYGSREPHEAGVDYESVSLKTEDGIRIRGWFLFLNKEDRELEDPFTDD